MMQAIALPGQVMMWRIPFLFLFFTRCAPIIRVYSSRTCSPQNVNGFAVVEALSNIERHPMF
jgi:hypothetical protein